MKSVLVLLKVSLIMKKTFFKIYKRIIASSALIFIFTGRIRNVMYKLIWCVFDYFLSTE